MSGCVLSTLLQYCAAIEACKYRVVGINIQLFMCKCQRTTVGLHSSKTEENRREGRPGLASAHGSRLHKSLPSQTVTSPGVVLQSGFPKLAERSAHLIYGPLQKLKQHNGHEDRLLLDEAK